MPGQAHANPNTYCNTTPWARAAPNAQSASNVAFSSFAGHWSRVGGAIDYRLDVARDSSFLNYVPGYQNLSVGNVTSYAARCRSGAADEVEACRDHCRRARRSQGWRCRSFCAHDCSNPRNGPFKSLLKCWCSIFMRRIGASRSCSMPARTFTITTWKRSNA